MQPGLLDPAILRHKLLQRTSSGNASVDRMAAATAVSAVRAALETISPCARYE